MFTKTTSKRCDNHACEKYQLDQGLGLAICDCGHRLKPVRQPDKAKQKLIVSVVAGFVVAVAGLLLYQSITRRMSPIAVVSYLIQHGRLPGRLPIPEITHPETAVLRWKVEAENDSMAANFTGEDASPTSEGIYRLPKPFNSGDRFRFHVYEHQGWVALLYRNDGRLQRVSQSNDRPTVLPDGDRWIRLDDHVGSEEFVLVTSRQPVEAINEWPDGKPFSEVLTELSSMKKSPDLSLARIEIVHQ